MWSAQCLLTAVSDDVGLECSNLRWLGIFTFSGACACVCLYWNSADNGKKQSHDRGSSMVWVGTKRTYCL